MNFSEIEISNSVCEVIMVTRLGYCAQKVCLHCASKIGISDELAIGMGSAFGTGMGHADICGCICGAHIVLGIRYGSGKNMDEAKSRKSLLVQKVTEFEERLKKKQRCRSCKDILGMDITQPGVMREAAEKGLFNSVCGEMLKYTCDILDDILDGNNKQSW